MKFGVTVVDSRISEVTGKHRIQRYNVVVHALDKQRAMSMAHIGAKLEGLQLLEKKTEVFMLDDPRWIVRTLGQKFSEAV